MFQMSVSDVICLLKDKLLQSRPDDGIFIGLDVSLSDTDGRVVRQKLSLAEAGDRHDWDLCNELEAEVRKTDVAEIRRFVYFAIVGHHVWIAVEPMKERWISLKDIPLSAWQHTCSHDSCWRGDGIDRPLTNLYFSWATIINKDIAPVQLSQFVSIQDHLVQIVNIKHRHVSGEDHRREILEITSCLQ